MTRIVSTILFLALVFTSCSNDESIDNAISTSTTEAQLKTYTLSRDANGNYTIDYELNDYTTVDVLTNEKSSTNDFYLSTGKTTTEKKGTKNLLFEDDYLKVGFYDDTAVTKGFIVEDDSDITATDNDTFLESYSIQNLGDDTYQVDFKVKEGVAVSYEYNEEDNIYEIQLRKGVSKTQEFSTTFTKSFDSFKIDFVNYPSGAAKLIRPIKKPRVISLS